MQIYEILLIVAIIAFVGAVFGIRIYKRIKHKPLDECSCCNNRGKKLLKEYHKKLKK